MKKLSKLLALILAIILIIGLLSFTNATWGNPISKAISKNKANEYLSQHYANTDYYVDEVFYSFKDGYYHAKIESPSSIDTHFTIAFSQTGKFIYDDYDIVTSKFNTFSRLETQYRDLIKTILENPDFPYKGDIQFGTLDFNNTSLKQEDLVIDKIYDIRELGKIAGKLVIYTESDDTSFTNSAKILLDIKTIFDNANIPFAYIDFVLEEPREENSTHNIHINIKDFPYEDIIKDNLATKIEDAHNKLEEYYETQDALYK